MRLAGSALRACAGKPEPIKHCSQNATQHSCSWRFSLLALFAFSLVPSAILPALPAHASTKTRTLSAFYLKQKSLYIGPHELFINHDYLRSTDLGTGVTTVVDAPGNKVWIFNEKKRCFFTTSADKMPMDTAVTSYTPYRYDLVNRNWLKVNERTKFGQRLVVYQMEGGGSKKASNQGFRAGHISVEVARYVEAPNISLSPIILKALENLYLIPHPKGLPFRVMLGDNKTPYKVALDTLLLEKKDVASSVFSLPKGFRQLANANQIADHAKRDAVLESVTDLLMAK